MLPLLFVGQATRVTRPSPCLRRPFANREQRQTGWRRVTPTEAAAAMLPSQGPKARRSDQLPSTGEQGGEGQRHPTGHAPGSPVWPDHGSQSPANCEARARKPDRIIRIVRWAKVQSQRGLRARGRGPLCMGPAGHLTRYHTKRGPPESSPGPGTFARTMSAQVSPVDLCEGEWQCRSSEHIFPA